MLLQHTRLLHLVGPLKQRRLSGRLLSAIFRYLAVVTVVLKKRAPQPVIIKQPQLIGRLYLSSVWGGALPHTKKEGSGPRRTGYFYLAQPLLIKERDRTLEPDLTIAGCAQLIRHPSL